MFPCPTSPPQGPGCQPGGVKIEDNFKLSSSKDVFFLSNKSFVPLHFFLLPFFVSLLTLLFYLSLLSPFLLLYAAFIPLLFSLLSTNLLCVCDLGHVTLALSEPQLSHLQNEAIRLTGLYNPLVQI
ncbi:hypothetical protein HJG60_008837 [Phyllostomus discolor]|uniref:Uncharacterized protein n=1 Tax=Phyllostomus discolor TaxID=89673 RepID=A0A833YZ48_9CHIR|nr:hypothetical protein HJG60_008837 [Phyllostomus discolor]